MSYVYSLSCDGNVFYIGVTKNMLVRYKQHLAAWRYIRQLLADNKVVHINHIAYLPNEEAKKKEKELIYSLTKMGQKLLNNTSSWRAGWDFHQRPFNVSVKEMQAFIDFKQKIIAYTYAYHHNLEGWQDMEHPTCPLKNEQLYEQTNSVQ